MTANEPRPSQQEWERHEATIKDLYHRQKLPLQSKRGKRSLIQVMKDNHNFSATQSQYITQFGKWKSPKNIKSPQWELLLAQLDQFQAQNIEARVLISGRVIKDVTIQRARRYVQITPTGSNNPSLAWLSLPEYRHISIETKSSDGRWLTYSPIPNSEPLSDSSELQDPSFQQMGSGALLDPIWSVGLNTGVEAVPLSQKTLVVFDENRQIVDLGPQLDASFSLSESGLSTYINTPTGTLLGHGAAPDLIWPTSSRSFSPGSIDAFGSSNFEAGFHSLVGPQLGNSNVQAAQKSVSDTSIPIFNFTLSPYNFQQSSGQFLPGNQTRSLSTTRNPTLAPDVATAISQHFMTLLRQGSVEIQGDALSSASKTCLGNVDGVLECLRSLLPESVYQCETEGALHLSRLCNCFEQMFPNILLHSIANGFAGFQGISIGLIFKTLRAQTQLSYYIFQHLGGPDSSLIVSLAENLFRAAVEACDVEAVRIITETMKEKGAAIDVNNILCKFRDKMYTPLELAAKLRDLDTIRLLVKMGADPNKTVEVDAHLEQGALELAIRMRSTEYEPVDEKITQILFEAGAKVRPKLLTGIAPWNTKPHFQMDLVQRLLPDAHAKIFDSLSYLTLHLDSDVVLHLVKKVIRQCQETNCLRCIVPNSNTQNRTYMLGGLERALVQAASRANIGLCKLLLQYIKPSHAVLPAAFLGGARAIIDLCVEQGAVIPDEAVFLDFHKPIFESATMGPRWTDGSTVLSEAIRSRDPSLLLLAEQLGAWAGVGRESNFEAAAAACADTNDLETMRKLLQNASIFSSHRLAYALRTAIHQDQQPMTLMLLSAGANVNDRSAYRAISGALKRQNRTVVDMILESDIDVHELGNDCSTNESVMELAGLWGNIPLIKDLVEMGFSIDSGLNTTALTTAVKLGAMDLVDLLLRSGANPNASATKGNSPLHEAVKRGDDRMLRYLLSNGANPADMGAFLEAMERKNDHLATLLVIFAAKYTNGCQGFGAAILIKSIQINDRRVFKALLEVKMDIHGFSTIHNCTPLGAAIRNKGGHDLESVSDLLDTGVGVNSIVAAPFGLGNSREQESNVWPRQTVLLEAIETMNEKMISLILEKGADVNRSASRGVKRTPLQKACEMGSYNIVQLLISQGADVNAPPALRGGGTALQLASGTGSIKIVQLLLLHNAQLNGPTSAVEGRSALEAAAENGRIELLGVLCRAAQGCGFETREVQRAMDFAHARGHGACVSYLRGLQNMSQGNTTLLMASNVPRDGRLA